jgi:hypothetical protein
MEDLVGPIDSPPRKPAVFAKFLDTDILDEQGRLMFSLLNAFATSGYPVLLFDSLPAERLGRYGLMAKSLPALSLTPSVPDRVDDMFYLFDREDRGIGRREWRKKIRVRFDIFAPFWLRQPVLMPFPLHPIHSTPNLRQRLDRIRTNPKRLRVFFSGETSGYTENRITYPKTKLPRLEIISTVRERMGERVVFVQQQAELERLLSAGYVDKCVILDTSKVRVPDLDWLNVLSQADFFLAPPGIVMPMCHNSVEALATGAIPIINYPEWFAPRLEHLRNSVVFDDKEDLIAKLELVLAMDKPSIASMQERAIAYYDAHLSGRSFTATLEARRERKIDVLMILEEYVRKNARRLNGRSVLIRGSAGAHPETEATPGRS